MILTITLNPAIDKIYLVNTFELGEVHRPKSMIDSPGGKGLNVARVAKILGENVSVSGFLGGSNGEFLSKKIEELGFENRFIQIEQQTRICINITDLSTQLCTEVLEAGPIISENEVEWFIRAYETIIEDVDVVTISGSLPKGIDKTFYSKLIDLANKASIPVLLDTSGEALKNGLLSKPYLVKPNIDEIKSLDIGETETMDDLIAIITYFKTLGIKLPIISMGKDGSLAGLSDGIYKVEFPKIETVNTVGSGDSFIAGCAVSLSRNLNEVDLIKYATACGSANTQFRQTGYVENKMVEDFFKKVVVKKVADYNVKELVISE